MGCSDDLMQVKKQKAVQLRVTLAHLLCVYASDFSRSLDPALASVCSWPCQNLSVRHFFFQLSFWWTRFSVVKTRAEMQIAYVGGFVSSFLSAHKWNYSRPNPRKFGVAKNADNRFRGSPSSLASRAFFAIQYIGCAACRSNPALWAFKALLPCFRTDRREPLHLPEKIKSNEHCRWFNQRLL